MKIFGFNTSKAVPDANAPVVSEEAQNSANEPVSASETTPDAEFGNESDLSTGAGSSTMAWGDVAEFPEDYVTPSNDDAPAAVVDLVNLEAGMENSEAAPIGSDPPRALFPGSFLGGEYEIREVISRGPINYYLADAGDYGAHDFQIVAERLAPSHEISEGPDAEFFPLAKRFSQDEREYAAWDFEVLQSLEEWSAPPNDETYFSLMGTLARGFLALEAAGLKPDLPPSSLFFDGTGNLKCFGFFDAVAEARPDAPTLSTEDGASSDTRSMDIASPLPTTKVPGMTALQQLSAFSSRFAKTNLAARATLRLDDEFGALPFSEEVKAFAKKLSEGEFSGVSEVVSSLQHFAPLGKTEAALLSDVGMERELNEDCGLIWKSSRAGHARNFELEVLAVADGMGGHEGGEVASDLALSALETAISARLNLDFADNSVFLKALGEILLEVNDAVVRLTENPPYASMRAKPGATLVCALRVGSRVFVGNVGDSRAYRWSEKTGLQRLTKDHSYVQDLLDSGALSEAEAWGHPDGSVITSHIGMMRGMKKDVFLRLLSAGDRLVLVSDGVVDTLRDAQIEEILAAHNEASALCAALVSAANDAGGFDNITVAALICR